MKYVITGSTGHISKRITEKLTAAGHEVTVITSSAAKQDEIKSIGAHPAVGSVEDRNFLIKTFSGADIVYLMIPPKWTVTDWNGYQKEVADHYIAAINANQIKQIVVLSSVGAHLRKGTGPVDGLGYLEEQTSKLKDANVLILRPGYFYYNLFSQIGMIKQAGFVGSTQPADLKMVLAHTPDIADVAAAHLLHLDFKGYVIEYIASDDSHTWAEIAGILGKAIGKPGLPYVELTDEQSQQGMTGAGLSQVIAKGYVEMGAAIRSGNFFADYWAKKPSTAGRIKLEDFSTEFAAAYQHA